MTGGPQNLGLAQINLLGLSIKPDYRIADRRKSRLELNKAQPHVYPTKIRRISTVSLDKTYPQVLCTVAKINDVTKSTGAVYTTTLVPDSALCMCMCLYYTIVYTTSSSSPTVGCTGGHLGRSEHEIDNRILVPIHIRILPLR